MKAIYRELCEEENSIPLFSQAWWLDAVAGDGWDVTLVQKKGKVVASLPYYKRTRFGFSVIGQPPLTKCLGPWIKPQSGKSSKILSKEKEFMTELIEGLPKFHMYSQNWDPSRLNWLPFYWQGFSQTTKYTYRLENLSDEGSLWSDLQENIRREIRKAENRAGVSVQAVEGVDELYMLNQKTFARQGLEVPYSKGFLSHVNDVAKARGACKTFLAKGADGQLHAAVYLVWDDNVAYYLIGGGDPDLRNSGATSLCMWEAIKFASGVSRLFDFEGSMIEPIERFFRSFGAIQTPYHSVSFTPSRLLGAVQLLRGLS